MIDFLCEFLAETYVEKAIFVKFEPQELASYFLSGKIIGYKFTSLSKDIKAITYYQAVLNKVNKNYIFEFIIYIY